MDFKGEKINLTEEIIITSKPIFENTILNIYKVVKKNNHDIEFLLRDFQLELRNIKKWKRGEIKQANYKLKRIVGFKNLLESLYKLNKKMFHITELDFKFDESLSTIDNFFKDVCLQIARTLWNQPHVIYEIYDNKMYNKFQHVFEKIIRDSIIFVLRRKARDDLNWDEQDNEEDNEELAIDMNINPNIPHDLIDEIEDNVSKSNCGYESNESEEGESGEGELENSEKDKDEYVDYDVDGIDDGIHNIKCDIECNEIECKVECDVLDNVVVDNVVDNVVVDNVVVDNIVVDKVVVDKVVVDNVLDKVDEPNVTVKLINIKDDYVDSENVNSEKSKKKYKIKKSSLYDYSKYNYLSGRKF